MKKTVWIWNHYAGAMYEAKGGRHYTFAKYLRRWGYEPVVFCCNAKHGRAETYFPDTALWQVHEAEEIGVPFVFVRGRTYEGNGKQRVLNMADFYRNVKKTAEAWAKARGKPDVIYASSVHPLTLVAGLQTAKHFGVPCVCEVRDLWPESIAAYSTRFPRSHPLMRLLYRGEKWIYRRSDALIFTMEGAYDYIEERGWAGEIPRSKVHCINNGVDLEQFCYNRDHVRIQDEDLEDAALFKVVYTGSIRRANQLDTLLEAAKRVTEPRVRFLIWGDGDQRARLEQRARDERIGNVVFKGSVAKDAVPYIVSRADLNFAHNAPQEIFRFGISFNKLFDYMAGEKPILCDFPCRYNPALRLGAGIQVEDPAPERIAGAVMEMSRLPEEAYRSYCEAGKVAAQAYDMKTLTRKLINVLEGT